MVDRWKRTVWRLATGDSLHKGKRYTDTCEARAELGADVPPFWHLAEVRRGDEVKGRGMARDPQAAKVMALWTAGLLKPVGTHEDEHANCRALERQLGGLHARG
ncbi:MAG: hypothetical protein KAI80_03305 [Hyphomicrobiaceae bacterium]|nr:hypothetical protein [Hyphomicrobiaceae bacterium]